MSGKLFVYAYLIDNCMAVWDVWVNQIYDTPIPKICPAVP